MKKLIAICALIVILGGTAYTAVDHQEDIAHYIEQLKPDPMKFNPYDRGQCTDYAFEKVKQDHHMIGTSWGDAKYWHTKAKADGYQVNQQPKAKALMQSPRGEQGHVAYIEKVNGDGSIFVSEMNFTAPHKITSRTISAQRVQDYHYIHPKKNPIASEKEKAK